MLQVKNVSGGYPGNEVLRDVSFSVKSGELFGIIGPNGSGKTTLLKMISGTHLPKEGEILLNERKIQEYTPRELAKILAVLPQVSEEFFSYTVKETVDLGRYAHQRSFFNQYSKNDEQIVMKAMNSTGVTPFADKLLNALSGGERQRVFLAQALAQEPKILLLDEPTNHLDLAFQKDLLDQLKQWTREQNMAVVSIFHDLNIASLYCDRLLLLHDGKMLALGPVDEVIEEDRVRHVYGAEIHKHPHPKVPKPQILLAPEEKRKAFKVDETAVTITDQGAIIRAESPLKVLSTEIAGGWKQEFIQPFTEVETKEASLILPIISNGKVHMVKEDVVFTVLVKNEEKLHFLVFINGVVSDEILVHALMSVSEAKTAGLGKRMEGAIVIAATQTGPEVALQRVIEAVYRSVEKGIQ